MKSGKLIASNDWLIEELIGNPDYDIREDGTIWTLIQRTGHRSKNNVWRQTAKHANGKGYLELAYKYKKLGVHRISFRKFIGPLQPDLVVNHKDCNKLNNSPSNLELIPQVENAHHFRKTKHK